MDELTVENMRKAIAESYDPPRMIGSFIVIAEVFDDGDDVALLTWWDGGTQWTRLGTVEWVAERLRQDVGEGEHEDV